MKPYIKWNSNGKYFVDESGPQVIPAGVWEVIVDLEMPWQGALATLEEYFYGEEAN